MSCFGEGEMGVVGNVFMMVVIDVDVCFMVVVVGFGLIDGLNGVGGLVVMMSIVGGFREIGVVVVGVLMGIGVGLMGMFWGFSIVVSLD